jgi:hypothetical protein
MSLGHGPYTQRLWIDFTILKGNLALDKSSSTCQKGTGLIPDSKVEKALAIWVLSFCFELMFEPFSEVVVRHL